MKAQPPTPRRAGWRCKLSGCRDASPICARRARVRALARRKRRSPAFKSAGLASLDQATIEKDKKGADFYVAVVERAGAQTIDVLAEILPGVVKSFPWPKSMRWGAASERADSLRWVRPLHAIVATFGPETEMPDVVPFEIDGIAAGNVTRGHRFLGRRESA